MIKEFLFYRKALKYLKLNLYQDFEKNNDECLQSELRTRDLLTNGEYKLERISSKILEMLEDEEQNTDVIIFLEGIGLYFLKKSMKQKVIMIQKELEKINKAEGFIINKF